MGLVSRPVPAFCVCLVLSVGLQAQGRDDFDVGLGLYERGLWEEAAKHFVSFIEEGRDKFSQDKGSQDKGSQDKATEDSVTEAWYRLGSCHKKLGKNKAAEKAFARVLERSAKFQYRSEARYQLGRLLEEGGKKGKAAHQFEALLKEAGEGHYLAAPACYALAECRRDLGKKGEALQTFQKAYELAPKGGLAFASLYQSGFLLLASGKAKAAARVFGRAAEDFPKDALALECRYLQGRALSKLGRYKQAEEAYRRAARQTGKRQAEALLGQAQALRSQGRAAEAPRYLLQALRIQTSAAVHLLLLEELAYILLDEGKPQEAVGRFDEALKLSPLSEQAARLHFGRGEALSDVRQFEAALEAQTRAEQLSSNADLQGDALYARLYLLHRLGRPEESLVLSMAFLKKHAEHRSAGLARFAQAENLFALRRYAEAAKVYAGLEGPSRFKARHKHAWCLWLQGKKGDAARAFARLVDDKEIPEKLREDALAMEALARLELGQTDQALVRADLYKLRYPKGRWLARCERVASRALEQQGKLDAAARRLAFAMTLTEGGAGEQDELGLADLLQKNGDYAKASAHYLKHVEDAGSAGFRALEGLAWCAFELGEIEACRRRGREALGRPEARKLGAALRQMLCSVELNEKQWKAAEGMARQFLHMHPDDRRVPEMRFSLALAMARGGKSREAEKALLELLKDGAGDRSDRAWYELAWTRRRLGKEKLALEAFAKVAQIGKDAALRGEARLHLAEGLLRSGNKVQAERELAKVEGAWRTRALYRLGFSQFEQKQYRLALKSFVRLEATKVADRYVRAAPFLSAECHYELGKRKAAAGLYQRYLKELSTGVDKKDTVDPTFEARARFHLGHCELVLDHPARAAALLRRWVAELGDKPGKVDRAQAWLWLGQAESRRSRGEAAEKAFKKATALSEGRIAAEAWYRVGKLRRDQGKIDGAIEAFLRLSILFDESTWVSKALFEAGLCFETQKKNGKAQKLYRELLDRYPGSDAAKEAQPRLKAKRRM